MLAIQHLLECGEYKSAFRLYEAVANDYHQSVEERVDAFAGMGSLVPVEPSLGAGDECGLSFFKRALELDPNNTWAMQGILSTFGDCFPDHQDVSAFRSSIAWLAQHKHDLDERTQEAIASKRRKYAHLLP